MTVFPMLRSEAFVLLKQKRAENPKHTFKVIYLMVEGD